MHVLALNKEGQWPYAEILLTTPGAFQEALNQVTIIEQQCIIEREDNEDDRPWSISVSIDENGHLDMKGYSQISKNYNFEFTIKYQDVNEE